MILLDLVREAAAELEATGVPSPRNDAEILVAHVAGLSRSDLYARNGGLDEDGTERIRSLVARRRAREPLAYVLGQWGFRRLSLAVDRRVLVPRPETEVVVERCLELLAGVAEPRVLDVGTGSGAIALALADEHPGARVTAVDRSADALAVARANVERLGFGDRFELVHGELLAGLRGPFDLVVSNPPYVAAAELESLDPEVRLHEPRDALVDTGLAEEIARAAPAVLRAGGWLVVECADGRAAALARTLRALGYADVATSPDLAGVERVVEGRRP